MQRDMRYNVEIIWFVCYNDMLCHAPVVPERSTYAK